MSIVEFYSHRKETGGHFLPMKHSLKHVIAGAMLLPTFASATSVAAQACIFDSSSLSSIFNRNRSGEQNTTSVQSDLGYWSSQFSQSGQNAYKKIIQAARNYQTQVKNITDIPAQQETKQFLQVLADEHPELFYVTQISLTITDSNGTKTGTYSLTLSPNAKSQVNAVEQAANTFLQGAPTQGSDYDKELFVHDKLVQNMTYTLGKKTIYNSLVEHRGNCMSYAGAMQYLLNKLGVNCRLITGTAYRADGSSESHQWNIVTLNGKEYATDACWDDAVGPQYVTSHRYFNLTNSQMSQDHKATSPREQADCVNDDQGYYKKNNRYFDSVEQAEAYLVKAKSTSNDGQEIQMATASQAQKVRADVLGGNVQGFHSAITDLSNNVVEVK